MKDVLVFIHGLWGTPQKTWADFQNLIDKDIDIYEKYIVHNYSYPPKYIKIPFITKTPTLLTLARGLATDIETRFDNNEKVIFVCHSMGGLIAKQYLIDQIKQQKELRASGALLYATPNNGADIAAVAKKVPFFGNNALRQICKNSDYIQALNNDWVSLDIAGKVSVKYILADEDSIVDEHSARQTFGLNYSVVTGKGHNEIIRPDNHEDLSYLVFKKFVIDKYIDRDCRKKQQAQSATDVVDNVVNKSVDWLLSGTTHWGPSIYSEEPRIANVVEGILCLIHSDSCASDGIRREILNETLQYLLANIDEAGLKSLTIQSPTVCTVTVFA